MEYIIINTSRTQNSIAPRYRKWIGVCWQNLTTMKQIAQVGLLIIAFVAGASVMESNNQPTVSEDAGEYQVTLEQDGAYIYDSTRFVGFLPFDSTSAFDKLMIEDNR